MTAGSAGDSYGLSAMQQGMVLHSIDAPGAGVYIQQLVAELHENLEVVSFQHAWQRAIARHSILRSSFHWEGVSEPLQRVHQDIILPWTHHDCRGASAEECRNRLESYIEADRRRGFDFTQPPVMRVALFQFTDEEYRLVWTFHHALLDGRSVLGLLRELFASYEAIRHGTEAPLPPSRPYRDYVDWLVKRNPGPAEQFWRRMLHGLTAPTPLTVATMRAADEREPAKCKTVGIRLPESLTDDLHDLAGRHQLTLNTLLQGAWALLLHRYSGEADVIFGATRSCRLPFLNETESAVGLFINTLPVRVHLSPDALVLPWLRELRARWREMREHEHTPLRQVQAWSDVPPGTPLFESILIFEFYELNSALRAEGGNWKRREFRLRGSTNYPLTVSAWVDRQLVVEIEFDAHRFDDTAVGRMLGHLRSVLEGFVAAPMGRLSDVPLLTMHERQQLLVEWNRTEATYPPDRCIHHLFESQAAKTPDAVAVVCDGRQLTYQELNVRANQLAHHLQTLGVGPEVLVAIGLERSLEMPVALLGVLKAGGAYVPIDPAYPPERRDFVWAETRAPVLLTQRRFRQDLPAGGRHVICLDEDWDAITRERTDHPVSRVTPDNLAYVLYTSGSTGRPKGVMVCHRSVCNFLFWRQDYFPLTSADRLLQKTSLSFDDSVWEFFEPFMVGARVVIVPPGGHQDSACLLRLIVDHQISAISFVPSMLRVFLEEPGVDACTSLRRVTTGGEILTPELQTLFFRRLSANLYNGYGPTETTVAATFWTCPRNDHPESVPIGRPIANTRVYVLDAGLRPVPIGVQGELYIGGAGLARGYFDQPALTSERFIPDPFDADPAGRLYKTGDLARYRPDGTLEFLGRIDHQVKLRGFRIELGEIESALTRCPEVKESVVVAREDVPGERTLVAYVVPAPGATLEANRLRAMLRVTLPDHMIPAAFVILPGLPLTPNGKVNRQVLPRPPDRVATGTAAFAGPRTLLEKRLISIWQDVLQRAPIGIFDDFFEIGGHSLHAMRVVAQLRKELDREISLRCLFEARTVAQFSEVIAQIQLPSLPVPRKADDNPAPAGGSEEIVI